MQVTNDAPKQDVTKTGNHSEVSTAEQKKREAEMESYFNPKDSADISSEGRVMQKALSDVKVLSMPKDSEGAESAVYSKQSIASSQQSAGAESKTVDMARLNQIASKMMQGHTVSNAEMKELEKNNPQLYARAKAKAKAVVKANTNTQTSIQTESQADVKESKSKSVSSL